MIKSNYSDYKENDLFNRTTQVENLIKIIQNDSDGFVATIDAPFGTGKTTFLKMLSSYVSENCEDTITIYYDAWENDFFSDPMLSLVSCYEKELKSSKISDIGNNLGPVIIEIFSKFIEFKTLGLVNFSKMKEAVEAKNSEHLVSEQYESAIQTKNVLIKLFKEIVEANKEKKSMKVIFLIDELDRCKPSFALELLEVIKFFFNIPNYYFLLSVHRDQLCSTIEKQYGDRIDSNGYLRRFIDFDFILSSISIDNYIDSKSKDFIFSNYEYHNLFEMLKIVSKNANLSLRDIDKIFKLLKLIVSDDWAEKYTVPNVINNQIKRLLTAFELHLLAFLLVLKIKYPNKYYNLINAKFEERELLDRLLLSVNNGSKLLSEDHKEIFSKFPTALNCFLRNFNNPNPNLNDTFFSGTIYKLTYGNLVTYNSQINFKFEVVNFMQMSNSIEI